MSRGKKKSDNPKNNASSKNEIIDQLTNGIQKLTVKGKKNKSSQKHQKGKKLLTPYQGKKQCFGFYECLKCKNGWASSHSWANTWQECLQCRGKVYPHQQWPKEKGGKKIGDKPHQQEYCGKCVSLGHSCDNRG